MFRLAAVQDNCGRIGLFLKGQGCEGQHMERAGGHADSGAAELLLR